MFVCGIISLFPVLGYSLVLTYCICLTELKTTGEGDFHDTQYDSLEQVADFNSFTKIDEQIGNPCAFTLHVYPTKRLQESYETSQPVIFTIAVVLIFMFTSLVFVLYDILVQRRQNKVMSSAVKTDAIVASLFPEQFRDQLYGDNANNKYTSSRQMLKRFASNGAVGGTGGMGAAGISNDGMVLSKPVADLYPDATVLMGDLAGFTSWSSVREPSQVFTLLEQIFATFDLVAKRRKV